MDIFHSELFLLLACVCVHSVHATIGTTVINCVSGSNQNLGSTTEGFEGDVESLTNIDPGDELLLEDHIFPVSKDFLELVHLPGETTGTIRTTKALDADALSQSGGILYYSVTCRTSGLKNLRTLKIMDINDNAPVFEQKLYTAVISEIERVEFPVVKVRAVDADVTPGNSRVTYSILDPAPDEFEVWNDGTIRLRSRLNYNTASFYNFTVKAADVGNLYDTATVTITVQDFDNLNPYFHHALYRAFIPENQVGTFTAVTPENIKAQDGDAGINQTVIYSIITVTPVEHQPNFRVDPNTGIVSVTSSLDREEIETVTLQIQAAQQDDSSKTTSAIVLITIEDVDDNAPEFDQSDYTAFIPENSPSGHFILHAKVTDQDQGGFVGTLRLVPDSVPFSIGPDGDVRVEMSSELDRETNQYFTFQIEARENPPSKHSATASVNITLTDENDNSPVFARAKYEGKVSTDQTVGMTVVKVEATDLDDGPNGQIRYFIEFGNDDGYFTINEYTGEITLNKTIPLLQNAILQYVLFVTATDGGSVSRSASALVDIKAPGDSRPQFLHKIYEGKVEEEKEAGVEIIKVTFLSVSPAVPVTLAVETEADKFSVDQLTGMLTTKVKLDHEVQRNYTVLVSVSDGVNRDEATVYVNVLDVNDNSPVFPSGSVAVTIPEDADIGSNVTHVEATDADSGLNGEIRYRLEGSAGMFGVNPDTGLIVVTAALDRETKHEYDLVVVAQDQGRPPLSATASVVVTLADVNDNEPIFSAQRYEAGVFENTTAGTDVIGVVATDKDDGPNAVVSYHIAQQEPPSAPAAFSIDATSGMISLARTLDYSKVKKYRLDVEARDGGSPTRTGSAVVLVLVEDVNNKPPRFSRDLYDVAVYENIAPGSPLVSLEVTDENDGGFSNGHFLLTSDVFSINNEGVVHLSSNSSLDRETRDNYVIQVVAVDQPIDGLSATAQVNVTVLDVNDNNPQYSKFQNPIKIPEDKTGEVMHIEVSDSDIGSNGETAVTTHSYDDVFGFTADGTLMVTGTLDREKKEVYTLVLVARDFGAPPRNSLSTLTVLVTDVNDNAPVFGQPSYSTRVLAKDVQSGDLVLTVSATDQDVGNNSFIAYRLTKDSDVVDLNPDTGAITWTRDLSHITEDTLIELLVTAEDHGIPPLNSTATVTIDVRSVHLIDTVVFDSATYVFSVKENEPGESMVGGVRALTGNPLIQITYRLMSHTELFGVDGNGAVKTLKPLDKEEKETYVVDVEAVDSRTPPNTAKSTVVIEVEDVNEAPVFERQTYTAEIFSVAPFRYPVVSVKASDPDVWDAQELRYSLSDSTSLLGIESETGQVYVLDLTGKGGETMHARVKATDKQGLSASTEIQIRVKDSSGGNIVVVTLNQHVHTVQMKMTETQKSLEKVLGWSVHVLSVGGENGMFSRASDANVKSYVSFVAVDAAGVTVTAQEVHEKLKSESESVKAELEKVFGPDVELGGLERESVDQENSEETVVIALGVLLALTLAALVTLTALAGIKYKKMKESDCERESFTMGKQDPCSVFTNAELLKDQLDDLQIWRSSRKVSEASQNSSVAVTATDNDANVTSAL